MLLFRRSDCNTSSNGTVERSTHVETIAEQYASEEKVCNLHTSLHSHEYVYTVIKVRDWNESLLQHC